MLTRGGRIGGGFCAIVGARGMALRQQRPLTYAWLVVLSTHSHQNNLTGSQLHFVLPARSCIASWGAIRSGAVFQKPAVVDRRPELEPYLLLFTCS